MAQFKVTPLFAVVACLGWGLMPASGAPANPASPPVDSVPSTGSTAGSDREVPNSGENSNQQNSGDSLSSQLSKSQGTIQPPPIHDPGSVRQAPSTHDPINVAPPANGSAVGNGTPGDGSSGKPATGGQPPQ